MAAKKNFSWKAGQSSTQNAVKVLPSLARAFFAQGKSLTSQVELKALHSFRIQSKRFRDTLELFRPCYTLRLERLLKSLRDMQQILGELNDLTTTRQMLSDRGFVKSHQQLLSSLETQLAGKAEQFFSLWKQSFARQGEERRWVNYLAGEHSIRPKASVIQRNSSRKVSKEKLEDLAVAKKILLAQK